MTTICRCGKGYVSRYDNKCGNCRSKKEQKSLDETLRDSETKTLEQIQQEIELRNDGLTWMIKDLYR